MAAAAGPQTALDLPGEIDLAMLVRQPEVISSSASDEAAIGWSELEPVVAEAIEECKAMRQREGGVLADELRHRLALLEASPR